jgi:hypothetical protein
MVCQLTNGHLKKYLIRWLNDLKPPFDWNLKKMSDANRKKELLKWQDEQDKLVLRQYSETTSRGPIIVASWLLVIIWALHRWVLPSSWLEELRRMLFESGWVPYGIVWWGIFGILYLFQVYFRRINPLKMAERLESEVLQIARTSSLDSQRMYQVLLQNSRDNRVGYFGARFTRLVNLYRSNSDLSAVQRLRDEILEHDEYMHQLGFSAVRCSEWAMPLFGFLGTVMGIGQAIASLKNGLSFDEEGKLLTNPTLIQESFSGMALAFETTLEGLVGLLIVGTLHAFLRKRLELALARAQPAFTQLIENTRGSIPKVQVEGVATLEIDMDLLRSEITTMRDEMQDRHLQQQQIEALAETVIDQDPRFKSIREIIFSPVVEFDVQFRMFSENLATFVSNHIDGHWRFVSGSGNSYGHQNAVLIQSNQQTCVSFFNLAEPEFQCLPLEERYDRITMCGDEYAILRQDQGELHLLERKNNSLRQIQGLSQHPADNTFPFQFNGSVSCAILVSGDPTTCQAGVLDFSTGSHNSQTIPGGKMSWKLSSLSPNGSALVLAGMSMTESNGKGDWSLLHIPVSLPGKQARPEEGSSALPRLNVNDVNRITLSGIRQLRQMVWISNQELLLLDEAGELWLFDLRRESPIQVKNERWKPAPDTLLIPGRQRWFARHCNQKLSMWKVWRTSRLHDYGDGVTKKADKFRTECSGVSQDGRFLWSGVEQVMAVWSFPEYQSDNRE